MSRFSGLAQEFFELIRFKYASIDQMRCDDPDFLPYLMEGLGNGVPKVPLATTFPLANPLSFSPPIP